jgi:hypothetical protein
VKVYGALHLDWRCFCIVMEQYNITKPASGTHRHKWVFDRLLNRVSSSVSRDQEMDVLISCSTNNFGSFTTKYCPYFSSSGVAIGANMSNGCLADGHYLLADEVHQPTKVVKLNALVLD